MPEALGFRLLTVAKIMLLWAHKETDLVPQPVVGFVPKVGDPEKFPHVLGVTPSQTDDTFLESKIIKYTSL